MTHRLHNENISDPGRGRARLGRHGRWIGLLLLFGVTACDDAVNAFVPIDEPFTLYGYLNPRSNTQRIRVIPIEQQLDPAMSESIDAAVTATNLATGEVYAWNDTYVMFEDSTFGHVFHASFRPAYGERYRLEVARSDGAISRVEVETPPDIRIVEEPSGSTAVLRYKIQSGTLPNIVQASMLYDSVRLQPILSGMNPIRWPVEISYRGEEEFVDGGWVFVVDLREDYQKVEDEFDKHCLTREYIALRAMRFVVFVGDPAWVPPGGTFDPETLAQPDAFTNVENGFGYFGAGYPVDFNAIQPASVLGPVGFATAGPCDPDTTPPTDPSCTVILPPC